MSTIFVVVHGIRPKPERDVLKASCLHFLQKSTEIKLEPEQVRLAYWADIAGHPEIPDDRGTFKKFNFVELGTIASFGIFRKSAVDIMESRLAAILNRAEDPNASAIVQLLAGTIGVLSDPIAGKIMRGFIRDVYVYFKRGIREQVKDRLRQELAAVPKGTRVVLIGHSLGSVVALDTLLSDNIKVDWLLTMGSPLGFNAVQAKLAYQPEAYAALPTKAPVWHNLFDLLDIVSLDYDLADDFPAGAPNDVAIRNQFAYSNGERNRHGLYGFLGNRETGDLIRAFLE